MQKVNSNKIQELNYYRVIIFRLLLALLLFWLSRLFFYIANTSYFFDLDFPEVLHILIFGLRFDVASIFMLNAPFLLMMTIPLPIRRYKTWRGAANLFYYVGNIAGLMANFTDVVYFRFTQKRMTGDIFRFADEIDATSLLPQFTRDYWPYQLVFVLFVVALVYFSRMVSYEPRTKKLSKLGNYSYQTLGFLLSVAIMIIGIRGGLQLKPINIITAGKVSEAKNAAFVLNTPFTIIKTMNMKVLDKKHYYDDEECERIFSPVYPKTSLSSKSTEILNKNIVIIVVESLSSEHIGAFNRDRKNYDGFTPFLDSLMQDAVVFQGFANGKQSIEGIPSILASIPSLMDRPYINSAYAGNKINSLASLLSEQGYSTAFYHGGTNGTMDFDGFADMAGFQEYYGRTEYNNEKDYDGNWGIFDEPFFQYFAKNLNQTPEPFFATIFSLSSHHPYTIPPQYEGKFKDGDLEIQKTIMYADYSLRKFFQTASSMPWFNETIFVITADHTSEAYAESAKSRTGMYEIPIIFYAPRMNLENPTNKTADQIDIMPSLLGLINYRKPYIAFGENLFIDSEKSFAINYLNGIYQFIMNDFVLHYNGFESLALYNYKSDPLLNKNILNEHPDQLAEMERFLKAYIQQYNNRMIENRLIITP